MRTQSEHELIVGVDLLESKGGTLVEDTLGAQTVVLVVVILLHALLESHQIVVTESFEDGLSGRVLIFSWEAAVEESE